MKAFIDCCFPQTTDYNPLIPFESYINKKESCSDEKKNINSTRSEKEKDETTNQEVNIYSGFTNQIKRDSNIDYKIKMKIPENSPLDRKEGDQLDKGYLSSRNSNKGKFTNVNSKAHLNSPFHPQNEQIQPSEHSVVDSKNKSIRSEESSEFVINKNITDEDVKNAPELILEELEGDQLFGNKLLINARGLVTGARKACDGFTYFGTVIKDSNDIMINDFILNTKIKEIGNHAFIIYYKKEVNKYFLRNYRDKKNTGMSFLLIRVQDVYRIKKTELIMFSDLFFQIRVDNEKLTIIKLACKKSPDEFSGEYIPDNGRITLGRDKRCTISFPGEKSFSKIHASFEYSASDQCWKLKDGLEKPSTNGIWFIPNHSYEIYNGIIFRIMGVSKFRISINKYEDK